jgi:hypothetical protein
VRRHSGRRRRLTWWSASGVMCAATEGCSLKTEQKRSGLLRTHQGRTSPTTGWIRVSPNSACIDWESHRLG